VEDHESLQTSAAVCKLASAIKHKVNNLLSDGVVTTSEVVSSIFLSGDQLLWMVQVTVGTGSDLIHTRWLEIHHQGTWHELASSSLGEESVEGIILNGCTLWLLTIWLNSVLQAEKLPAGVTALHTGLSQMNKDNLTHDELFLFELTRYEL
jgi:hypothetical protein